MEKYTFSAICGAYINRLFKNVSRNGDWINFSCPIAPYSIDHKFKEDKSPSCGFIVTDTIRTHVKCYTCKYQGSLPNLLRYLQTKNGTNYAEIIESITKQEEDVPDFENRVYIRERKVCEPLEYADLFDDVSKSAEATRYLTKRHISLTTASKLGLGYHPEHKRITFPVKDKKGLTYGFTARAIEDEAKPRIMDYYFPKSMFILGIEHWTDLPTVLVEGLFAYASLHEITKGRYFPYNIGAIMGSSLSSDQAKLIIAHGSPVYCLLDNDNAGKTGMYGKQPMPDWSKAKIEKEKAKGMVWMLEQSLPTFVMNWPKDELNKPKIDPADLTFEELCCMLQKPKLILR